MEKNWEFLECIKISNMPRDFWNATKICKKNQENQKYYENKTKYLHTASCNSYKTYKLISTFPSKNQPNWLKRKISPNLQSIHTFISDTPRFHFLPTKCIHECTECGKIEQKKITAHFIGEPLNAVKLQPLKGKKTTLRNKKGQVSGEKMIIIK